MTFSARIFCLLLISFAIITSTVSAAPADVTKLNVEAVKTDTKTSTTNRKIPNVKPIIKPNGKASAANRKAKVNGISRTYYYKSECSSCRHSYECRSRRCYRHKCVYSSKHSRCFAVKKPPCSYCTHSSQCSTHKCWYNRCVYDFYHYRSCFGKKRDDDDDKKDSDSDSDSSGSSSSGKSKKSGSSSGSSSSSGSDKSSRHGSSSDSDSDY